VVGAQVQVMLEAMLVALAVYLAAVEAVEAHHCH
jgi:hypothetical protein